MACEAFSKPNYLTCLPVCSQSYFDNEENPEGTRGRWDNLLNPSRQGAFQKGGWPTLLVSCDLSSTTRISGAPSLRSLQGRESLLPGTTALNRRSRDRISCGTQAFADNRN